MNNMPTPTQKKFKELKKQIEDAKKTAQESAKTLFTEMSADLFAKNPDLVSFSWSQYTPYWNDGDTCEFSANIDYPTVTFKADDGKIVRDDDNMAEACFVDEDGELEAVEDSTPYEKQSGVLTKQVVEFLSEFEEEDLEIMFGDHIEITVPRKGKGEIEGYEHD